MDVRSDQANEFVIQKGKYGADEKLEFLNRYWETGQSGLPEEDKLDFAQRDNIVKWERNALAGGRRGLEERIPHLPKQTSALAASVAKDPSMAPRLQTILTKKAQGGRLRKSADVDGLPTAAGKDAIALFRMGMLEWLGYTSDTGEIPSARSLARVAGPFPSSGVFEGISTAACLFTCAQYGRQDVIHVYKAGIPDVTLVDLEPNKMEQMKRIYRPEWTYKIGDYRDFLASTIAAKIQYDLVTADPPIPLSGEIAGERLGDLVTIARKVLCTLYTTEYLEKDGYKAGGLEQMSRSISNRTGRNLKVMEVTHRNLEFYWAVIHLV
jgi:hypothetical protein